MAEDQDKTLLQQLAAVLADYGEWLGDMLGASTGEATGKNLALAALFDDLGLSYKTQSEHQFSVPPLAGIKAYRDAANPGFEAWIDVANDVRALIEAVLAIKEAADLGGEAVVDEVGQKIIDLLTLNYVRARWPKLYYWMEFARFSTEPTTIYGTGGTGSERFGSSLLALIRFVLAPVETLGRLAFAKDDEDRPHMATEADARKVSDATFLHLAGFLAFLGHSSREVGFDSRLGDDVAINALYGWDQPRFAITPDDLQPTAADTLSERMLSLQVRVPPHAYSGGAEIEGALRMSAAWVPADQGGPGFFVSLGGSAFRFALDRGGRWVTQGEARFDAPFGMQFGGDEKFRLTGAIGDGQMHAIASFASRPMEPGKFGFRLSLGGDNGLQIGRIALSLKLDPNGLDTRISFHDCKLALDGASFDDFIGSLLPKQNTSVEFSFGTGYSTKDGFFTTGDVPLLSGRGQEAPPAAPATPTDTAARTAAAPPPPQAVISNGNGGGGIPIQIPIGKSLGPIRLHDALLELSRDTSGDTPRTMLKTALSFSAQIGPVYARVDKIGISFALEFPEDRSKANLHFANVGLGFVPPTSISLLVDAKKVKGGGFLFHDAAKHQYAGVMELTISGVLAVKAFGIITTRMPDGSKGYSLLIMITAETTSETGSLLNLPMGFRLTGIGGLLAIHRTASPEALRAGLKNRTLESILFPKDPVRNAPTIIAALDTVFPLQRGSYMVGLLVRVVWGVPKLITIDLALIIEWGVHERFIILGRISAILPRPDKDLLRLNLDSIGIFDFNEGTLEIDAALVDSRLLNKFVITGSAAVRARWNSPRSFALAVGGMNKNFTPPKNFPKLERVTLSLTTGDNPRLTCEAYIALTANTVQLGAHAHLYAAAYGFSVEGEAGFDVLIRLLPFHFLAEFYAGMQLKKGSSNLFKVKVEGALEGPVPLAVRAKATFEILWWDVSIRVNVTLFGGAKPAAPPGVNAFEQLRVALNDARSWSAEVPGSASRIVSLRERTVDDGTLRAHPLGTLTVRQAVVPLNLSRDIDKFGESPLDGARRFAITKVAFDGGGQPTDPLRDDFAPSQFFEMSDEAKLESPSYEPMDAGVRVGATEITLGFGERVESPIVYETRVIDREAGKPPRTRSLGDYKLSTVLLSMQALQGAAGRSVLRRGAQAEAAKADAPAPFATLKTVAWAAVGADLAPAPIGPGAASGAMTFVEASVLAKSAPQFQVVRAFEVLGALR